MTVIDTLGLWDDDFINGPDWENRSYLQYELYKKVSPAVNQHGFVMINKNPDSDIDISTLHYRNEYTKLVAEKKITSHVYHLEKTDSNLTFKKTEKVNADSYFAEKIMKSKITILF